MEECVLCQAMATFWVEFWRPEQESIRVHTCHLCFEPVRLFADIELRRGERYSLAADDLRSNKTFLEMLSIYYIAQISWHEPVRIR